MKLVIKDPEDLEQSTRVLLKAQLAADQQCMREHEEVWQSIIDDKDKSINDLKTLLDIGKEVLSTERLRYRERLKQEADWLENYANTVLDLCADDIRNTVLGDHIASLRKEAEGIK